ncbi:MAG: hypothetical protein AAB783_02645 [Patescibacteria group bacterium]
MGKFIIGVIVVALVGFGAYFILKTPVNAPGNQNATVPPPTSSGDNTQDDKDKVAFVEAVYKMNAVKTSGQSGTVIFTQVDGKAHVELNLQGSPKTTPQPAHIHVGSCAEPGAVKYPLTNVVGGVSTTTLEVSVETLSQTIPFSVVVHKSVKEVGIYTVCGDVLQDNVIEAEPITILINDKSFSPAALTVKAGTIVTFKNEGINEHWPASAMHPTHIIYPGSNIEKCNTAEESKIFDACRGIPSGASWSFQFNEKGTWRYHDHLVSGMFGAVTVE